MGSIVLGFVFLLLIGPAIWIPSLLRWGWRTRAARVRGPALLLGDAGSRVFYICLGAFVSLIGLWFIGSGAVGLLNRARPQLCHIADHSQLPVSAPDRILRRIGLSKNALAFSPDGASLLVGSGRKLQVVDVSGGTVRDSFSVSESGATPPPHVQLMASSSDHHFVAVGFGTGSTANGQGELARMRWDDVKKYDLQMLPYSPNSLAISSSGRYAMAAPLYHGDSTPTTEFCIVDFEREEPLILGEPPRVMQVAFRGDDDTAVLGCDGSTVVLYDVAAQEVIAQIQPGPKEPRGACFALSVSSDGRFAATSHANGDVSIRLWDLEGQVCVYRRELPHAASRVAFAQGRSWFATGGFMDRVIGLSHRKSGDPFRVLATPMPDGNGIHALAVSPTDDIIAARYDEDLFLWRVDTGTRSDTDDSTAPRGT